MLNSVKVKKNLIDMEGNSCVQILLQVESCAAESKTEERWVGGEYKFIQQEESKQTLISTTKKTIKKA